MYNVLSDIDLFHVQQLCDRIIGFRKWCVYVRAHVCVGVCDYWQNKRYNNNNNIIDDDDDDGDKDGGDDNLSFFFSIELV